MSLNTYEIATKFLIQCFTLPSISVGINMSSNLWFVSAHNHSLPLNPGAVIAFCTKDKLHPMGRNHFLGQWIEFHASTLSIIDKFPLIS